MCTKSMLNDDNFSFLNILSSNLMFFFFFFPSFFLFLSISRCSLNFIFYISEKMRSYLTQCRQELGQRMVEKVIRSTDKADWENINPSLTIRLLP